MQESVPNAESTPVATTETTRIHHADKHSASTYWTLHTVFLSIVVVAVLVILTARIKPSAPTG